MQDTTVSLTSLAEWVRSLPITSLAPVGVLFVAGLLLLCFGQRLLKPVLVLAAIFLGVIIAARIGHAVQPTLSPLVWSAIGAISGLILAILGYRLVLGVAVGAIGAVAAMLLALTATQMGWIDAGPQPAAALTADGDGSPIAPLDVDDPLVAAAWIVQQAADGPASAAPPATDDRAVLSKQLDDVAPGLGPAVVSWLDRFNGLLAGVGERLGAEWNAMPKPLRTLLMASAAAGGFLGFVAGVACPTWAAATLTSLFGSLLVVVCGAPLVSRVVSAESLPELKPLGWLSLWMALAAAGWIFQWVTRPVKPTPKGQREPAADAEA